MSRELWPPGVSRMTDIADSIRLVGARRDMGRRGYFFYNDTEERSVHVGGFGRWDPNKSYVRHYANWLELSFIAIKSEGLDKWQAEKELKICEGKLERCRKHGEFELGRVLQQVLSLKRQWERHDVPDRWSK